MPLSLASLLTPRRGLAAAALASSILLAASNAPAVAISIHPTDSAGEGFLDQAPRDPVGGNPGTTLGAQRLFVLEHAATAWSKRLVGDIPIVVAASFDPLGGDDASATLGYTSPTTVHRDFTGAPIAGTWFVSALANQLYGDDLNDLDSGTCPEQLVAGHCPEIIAQFNSSVDTGSVLGGIDFYYGIDGKSGNHVDFLAVVLHELPHGLGLLDLVDAGTGAKYFGFDDAFIYRLKDSRIDPKRFISMTDAQRKTAMRDDGHLAWAGAAAVAKSSFLTAGTLPGGGLLMFAPTQFIVGSSVDHVDTRATPNELMEPYIQNPPTHDPAITLGMLVDTGWTAADVTDCGDANGDGKRTTTDAAFALQAAVGLRSCPATSCDVNSSGGVTTADGLVLLKRMVGQDIQLSCPLF